MRQVPSYLLIGNGRVAKHFQAYFSQLSIHYDTWCRQQSEFLLQQALCEASHILLLIQDDAIAAFIKTHLKDYQGIVIHCSGSLVVEGAYGAHPLMTFSHELYARDVYESIPFIIDHNAPEFNLLLPQLPNQHQRLHHADKAKYHALCVMSGNFSCLLWQQFFEKIQTQFGWPMTLAYPYLRQQMQNLMAHPTKALTGPLVRRDHETMQRNIKALQGDPLQTLYLAFVDFYEATQKVNNHECI